MEASIIQSNQSVKVRFQINKGSLKECTPKQKEFVVIHEMYQCSTCYKIFNEIEKLSTHGCPVRKPNVKSTNCSQEKSRSITKNTARSPLHVNTPATSEQHISSDVENASDVEDASPGLENTSDVEDATPALENASDVEEEEVENVSPDADSNKKKKRLRLKCRICDLHFSSREELKAHSSVHRKTYKCKVCDVVSTTIREFYTHKKTHRKEKPVFQCDLCGKKYHLKVSLSNHMDVAHTLKKYQCHMCDKICSSRVCLNMHFKTHYEKLFACDICGRKYYLEKMLDKHYQNIHVKKMYRCEQCGKEFRSSFQIKRHRMIHDDKKYECEVCGKTFTRPDYLRNHCLTHSEERGYACNLCPKRYKNSQQLWSHKLSHGGGNGKYTSGSKVPKEKTLSCDRCGLMFAEQIKLENHYRLHTGERPFKCEHCDKAYRSKDVLYQHSLSHRDTHFMCELCGKKSKTKTIHQAHMNLHSEKYMCETCGKCCGNKTKLMSHYESHKKEKPFECDVCHKRYGYKCNRDKHRLSHN